MKKRLAAITAIVALGLGTFAAPASAETRTGSTSCSVGYRVTAFTECSAHSVVDRVAPQRTPTPRAGRRRPTP